jgi:hypothetical protein
MKNYNDTFENLTRDFPPCSALPQPTAPLSAPDESSNFTLPLLSKTVFIQHPLLVDM